MTPAAPETGDPLIGPRHLQAVCGVALGVMVLVQFQRDLLLVALAVALVGFTALGLRLALNPLLVLVPVVIGQVLVGVQSGRRRPSPALLDAEDVLMCVATLTYLAGHYRLYTLWFGIGPTARPRRAADTNATVGMGEMVGLLALPPLFALLAQGWWALLPATWRLPGMPPQWSHLVVLLWTLMLGLYVTAHGLRSLRRRRLGRDSARLLLQDVLWHETRGEQRRLQRWATWRTMQKPQAPG